MSSQMTIRDIAGFCPEEAVWKMIADVSECLLKDDIGHGISPNSVLVDGNTFTLNATQHTETEFNAPEHHESRQPDEKEKVWALGAIAYYASTGHFIFGGHGGRYQKEHPSVPLPALPKGLQSLTQVLQKCLCYDSMERIGLKDLSTLARKALEKCGEQRRKKAKTAQEDRKENNFNYTGEQWPEEMIEV